MPRTNLENWEKEQFDKMSPEQVALELFKHQHNPPTDATELNFQISKLEVELKKLRDKYNIAAFEHESWQSRSAALEHYLNTRLGNTND